MFDSTPPKNYSRRTINLLSVDKVFTYFGSIVCWNRNLDAEISTRVAKVNATFSRLLRPIFHKPQISRSITSIVFYSSETWPLPQAQIMTIDAVQLKYLRKIKHARWHDRVRNTYILRFREISTPIRTAWVPLATLVWSFTSPTHLNTCPTYMRLPSKRKLPQE